jgi:uncharacterized protein YbbC (DUF1343 family)
LNRMLFRWLAMASALACCPVAGFSQNLSAQLKPEKTVAQIEVDVAAPSPVKHEAPSENTTITEESHANPASNKGSSKMTNLYPPNLPNVKVKLGDEVLFENPKYKSLLKGKRLGLVTNPTGVDSKFIPTIDKLAALEDSKLVLLFAPEHGLRGAEIAGEHVKSGVDPVTGIPVQSLHGKVFKPTAENMEQLDVLLYDLQDIGNRSYTNIATLKHCMRAAKEHGNKKVIVLDRPNPMGGELVDGNVLDKSVESNVGWAPVAFLNGMTPGETALWINEHMNIGCDLTVVPMEGWKRRMKWWDTGLPWIPTSTHMQHPETCWHIAITGILGELHKVNEGVGYPAPFEYIGAPWIQSIVLANELNSRKLPGLYFRPVFYKPFYGRYKDEQCGGVQTLILDYDACRPVEAGLHVMTAIEKLYPKQDIMRLDDPTTVGQSRAQMFIKVMGTTETAKQIKAQVPALEIAKEWAKERAAFMVTRKKHLLYK